MSFENYGLDKRLLEALKHVGLREPTAIQEKAIPLALNEGKDIVAMARTGSGKTAAYLIPIINGILSSKSTSIEGNKALILVPTRELAEQVLKNVRSLTRLVGSSQTARAVNLASTHAADTVQSSLLAEKPSIIITTPARAVPCLESGKIQVSSLRYLVIDEADLMMSYGYEKDMTSIQQALAQVSLQTWIMSATLSEETNVLKSAFCKNVAVIKLHEDDPTKDVDDKCNAKLSQYYCMTAEWDKFLLAFVILRLELIRGKILIFVNNIDRGYRLKLFLEQFGIRSCVLNAQLPLASRLHIVNEFNKSIYNLLIATDEGDIEAGEMGEHEEDNGEEKDQTKMGVKDKEYGVSRGVDFKNVACVLNFDLPTSARAYVHRIGRTARAKRSGMALSFVVPKSQYGKNAMSCLPSAQRDEKILARITKSQSKAGNQMLLYEFKKKQVESFRYRAEDAFRAVTKVAVREARVKEIRQELLTSEKLKRHFEENPGDLAHLRHDKISHTVRTQAHLKTVPDYLVPGYGTRSVLQNAEESHVHKDRNRRRGRFSRKDPLKSFK